MNEQKRLKRNEYRKSYWHNNKKNPDFIAKQKLYRSRAYRKMACASCNAKKKARTPEETVDYLWIRPAIERMMHELEMIK